MTHAADDHRNLDRSFGDAVGEPGHALVRSRDRGKDSRTLRAPRVLLLEVEVRTSERTGKPWYSAWLGKCRLVGFEDAELNARGPRTIKFYAETPTQKPTDKETGT